MSRDAPPLAAVTAALIVEEQRRIDAFLGRRHTPAVARRSVELLADELEILETLRSAIYGDVLLLAVALFWGSRLPVFILTLALLSVPAFCRVARASTLSWARRDFILAARAIGASDLRIMFCHIAPNILPATAAYGLLTVAVVIIAEGTLSFLGLSVAPPTPSWGGMIAEGKEVLAESPHVSFFPAVVMFLTVLSFNMLGDRIRELNDLKIYR